MGKSVLFYNILCSFEISLYINIQNLIWLDAQFLAEELSRYGISLWLIRRKATDTTLASSKGSDQTNFTVLIGQKTGWISGGFKLKPVTGVLAPSGIGTIRSQWKLSQVLLILVSVTSDTYCLLLCASSDQMEFLLLWMLSKSILKIWGVS